MVSSGRRLEQLPTTAAAFAAGEITAGHARVITRAMTPCRVAEADELGIALAETDRVLADLARQTTPDETARGVARWVAGVDPDGALDDAADTRRRFTMASGLDGRVHLRGDLDNGALLCERHHTACPEGGFTVTREPGSSRRHAWRPDGTEVLIRAGP